jgi:hypothetical protein
MKYAIWNLVAHTSQYLIGPESKIAELGGIAESSWTNGIVEQGADILGYVTGDLDAKDLSLWNYREVTQSEALEFCQDINPNAYLTKDGRISAPIQE